MATFGLQCDAITKTGKRCRCKNRCEMPCAAVYDARMGLYRADEFRPVRLCDRHSDAEGKLRRLGPRHGGTQRFKLHHGGWFGGFNKHNYGNLVLNCPSVDWSKARNWEEWIKKNVPKFWAKREEE